MTSPTGLSPEQLPAPEPDRASPRNPIRRNEILQAAHDLFVERGYGGVSIDELIRRIGGSKTTFYRHFGSKEGLFIAVVDGVVGGIVKPLPDLKDLDMSLEDVLLFVAEEHHWQVLSDQHIQLIRLVAGEVCRFPSIGSDYYEHGPALGHAKLARFLRQEAEAGEIVVADPVTAAEDFFGMLLHHGTLKRLYGVAEAPTIEESCQAASEVVSRFLTYIGSPGT